MHQVTIRPEWTIKPAGGGSLAPRVIELLVKIQEHGSLANACQASGLSYRHAWELIRQGEALFGERLVHMERGKGSSLSVLGEKLVWADRRIVARLSPVLDSLASELEAEIEKVLSPLPSLLRIHASHGFAMELLHSFLAAAGVATELKYCDSGEALQSLRNNACDVAGFHVALGDFEAESVARFDQILDVGNQKIIHVAVRHQGFMVANGNPKKIYSLKDLARPGMRFVNRQAGSGTRFLFDLQLQKEGILPSGIKGYEQCEYTHAAVAAFVASGMADVGYGVETPARQFKLDFIPSQIERYFLLCDQKSINAPPVQKMIGILRSEEYRAAVDRLPGYESKDSGVVMDLGEAFETLRPVERPKVAATRSRRRSTA
jgi:molybdate transport repressor ModE-like protein